MVAIINITPLLTACSPTPIGKRPPSAMSKNVLQRDLQDRQRCEENAATARLPAKPIKYW